MAHHITAQHETLHTVHVFKARRGYFTGVPRWRLPTPTTNGEVDDVTRCTALAALAALADR